MPLEFHVKLCGGNSQLGKTALCWCIWRNEARKDGRHTTIEVSKDLRGYTAVIERCKDTELYLAYIRGFPGANSQAKTLDQLRTNLEEVLLMLLEDGEPLLEADFAGTQIVSAAR